MAELKAEWERIKPQGAGMVEEVAWMQEKYEQLARSTMDGYTSFITAGYDVMRAKELELSAWKECDVYEEIKVDRGHFKTRC